MAKIIVGRQRQIGCTPQNSCKGDACLRASKRGTDTVMDAITKGEVGFGLYPIPPNRRNNAIDPVTGERGTVNRYVRRQVRDVPLFGYSCMIDMELAQVFYTGDF